MSGVYRFGWLQPEEEEDVVPKKEPQDSVPPSEPQAVIPKVEPIVMPEVHVPTPVLVEPLVKPEGQAPTYMVNFDGRTMPVNEDQFPAIDGLLMLQHNSNPESDCLELYKARQGLARDRILNSSGTNSSHDSSRHSDRSSPPTSSPFQDAPLDLSPPREQLETTQPLNLLKVATTVAAANARQAETALDLSPGKHPILEVYPQAMRLSHTYRQQLMHTFNSFDYLPVILKPLDTKLDLRTFLVGIHVDDSGIVYRGAKESRNMRTVDIIYFYLAFEEFNRDFKLRRKLNQHDVSALHKRVQIVRERINSTEKRGSTRGRTIHSGTPDLTVEQLHAMLDRLHAMDKKSKNFQCECCGKSFKSIAQLEEHLKHIHAQVVLFFCFICQETQTRNHSTHYHMCVHMDMWKYECHYCEKDSTRRFHRHPNHFKEHIIKEHLICVYCPKPLQFPNLESVHQHIETIHPKHQRHVSEEDLMSGIAGKTRRKRKSGPSNEQTFELAADMFNFYGDTRPYCTANYHEVKEAFEADVMLRYKQVHNLPKEEDVPDLQASMPVAAQPPMPLPMKQPQVVVQQSVAGPSMMGVAGPSKMGSNASSVASSSDGSSDSSRTPSPVGVFYPNGLRVLLPRKDPSPPAKNASVIIARPQPTPAPITAAVSNYAVNVDKRKAEVVAQPSKRPRVRGFEDPRARLPTTVVVQQPCSSGVATVPQGIDQHATFKIHPQPQKSNVVYMHDLAASYRKQRM